MDDDGIMLQIYDNIGDELKAKNKLLEKEKEKVIDFLALFLYSSHMSDTNWLVLPKKKARTLKESVTFLGVLCLVFKVP